MDEFTDPQKQEASKVGKNNKLYMKPKKEEWLMLYNLILVCNHL
jgi:hypothetical protein